MHRGRSRQEGAEMDQASAMLGITLIVAGILGLSLLIMAIR